MLKKCIILFLVLVLSLALCACKSDEVGALGQKIMNEVDNSLSVDSEGEVVINLSEIADFDWNKAIAFSTDTMNWQLTEALGFEYSKPKNFGDGLVFFKDEEVVYQESYPHFSEHPHTFYLYLEPPNIHFHVIFPNDAEFNVRRFLYNKESFQKPDWCYCMQFEASPDEME